MADSPVPPDSGERLPLDGEEGNQLVVCQTCRYSKRITVQERRGAHGCMTCGGQMEVWEPRPDVLGGPMGDIPPTPLHLVGYFSGGYKGYYSASCSCGERTEMDRKPEPSALWGERHLSEHPHAFRVSSVAETCVYCGLVAGHPAHAIDGRTLEFRND